MLMAADVLLILAVLIGVATCDPTVPTVLGLIATFLGIAASVLEIGTHF